MTAAAPSHLALHVMKAIEKEIKKERGRKVGEERAVLEKSAPLDLGLKH